MEINFWAAGTPEFSAITYIRILIAIAKADKDNGPPEYRYVREQAERLGLDYDHFFETTDKTFSIQRQKVPRPTAMIILKDAILLASMDKNFSLPEKQRVYMYAEKLDVPRKDVDALEAWLADYRRLREQWDRLTADPY